MSALPRKQTSDCRLTMFAMGHEQTSMEPLSLTIFERPVSILGSQASLYLILALPLPDRYAG
jgi:hypothetical protein